MSDTTETIATLLQSHRPRGKNQGYPEHVRAQVGAWARAERARGRGWGDLARRLPVTPTTLQSWAREAGDVDGLVPVIVADSPPTAPAPPQWAPVLVTPRGYRVEGLDFDGIARLVERLG